MTQYVVNPDREVCHGGVKYLANEVIEGIPEDAALIHIEKGSLRPFIDQIDASKLAPQEVPQEASPEESDEALPQKGKRR
jgi:hypothetical protein